MAERRLWIRLLGWTAVLVELVVVGVWSHWGIIENFHEGWHHDSFWPNVGLMFGQYLSLPIVFTGLTLLALWRRGLGFVAFLAVALFAAWFLAGAHFSVTWLLIVIPVSVLGLGFFFGRPEPLRWARRLVVAVPLLIIAGVGIPVAVSVAGRIDDGNYGERTVAGNGVTLTWAPSGPGWPSDEGVDWAEAMRRARHLSADGLRLEETPQDIWRLPTVDELVRSQARRGENAGGVWDAEAKRARYERRPDKETPLWRSKAPLIYLWTATEVNEERAYIVVYHGGVFEKTKRSGAPSFGFRAVREPDDP